MAKTKTVHTSAISNGKSCSIAFPGAKLTAFGRVDKASGSFNFACSLGKGLDALFNHMGWALPGDKTTVEKYEGSLKGGMFILTSKDKLIDAEVELGFKNIKGFECHRLELEGRKGKGFRRELRFSGTFEEEDGAAKLESYMMTSDNARGSLKVTYYPEEVQTEIDLSSDEARQAILGE